MKSNQEWPEYRWRTRRDQNGLFRPKWTILAHFGPADAKIRVILTKIVILAILDHLVQYTFRQYQGDFLSKHHLSLFVQVTIVLIALSVGEESMLSCVAQKHHHHSFSFCTGLLLISLRRLGQYKLVLIDSWPNSPALQDMP